jgi:NADH-quinone oxidoreductase subunit L
MQDVLWLIPALPLAGFVILLFLGRRIGNPLAGWLATAMIGGSFVVAVVTFFDLLSKPEHERLFTQTLFTWVPAGALRVDAGFFADPLAMTMVLFVTGIGTLIHLYSIGYMSHDADYSKFFVYLNLFAFSMLVLVLGDNFVMMFLGWEGVGACSYFLISFWFTRNSAAVAGKKAFVTNRIGDFGFMLAMFLTFATLGTLQYSGVLAGADTLSKTTATAIALLFFLGAVGKSAQLPLYVWLPDAMEGPTPVSALIHAATMVTAGVYLMCRINPILGQAPDVLTAIAWVGAATALFAATVAIAQDDIKKVLAYSTVSQLGYMFLAVGSGAYVAAIFHMVTHAFFKALLFLGAGSVIHGLHDEQDMKRMGGLRKWMPVTAGTFIVGWLAIAGIPPFAGFWSKDDILLNAWEKSPALWAIGFVTALLTAYYMSREVFLVFFGGERWRERDPGHSSETAEDLPEHEPAAAEAHHGAEPHESPWTMTLPLVALAALSIVGGLVNLPFKSQKLDLLERWLHPVFGERLHEVNATAGLKWVLLLSAVAAGVIGILVAARYWLRRADNPGLEPAVLENAWYVDRSYSAFFGGPGRWASTWLAYVMDAKVVDGAVNGVGSLVRGTAQRVRRAQTGYVRNYALGIAGGAVLVLAFMLLRTGVVR